MKTIITYGTFDLFHVGHVRVLNRLKELGDRLIVGISTDEFNAQKGKMALMPYADRKEVLESVRCVDLVIPETSWEQKINDIKKYDVQIFGIGDDWRGKFDYLSDHCEVVYLERTYGISSSSIKTLTSGLTQDRLQDMRNAVEAISGILKSFGN
jgi:glycerol-3-phosphate cytidylyltransferase